jgi:hypothetical protein
MEHFNLDHLYSKPRRLVVSKAFYNIQEYSSHGHVIAEI